MTELSLGAAHDEVMRKMRELSDVRRKLVELDEAVALTIKERIKLQKELAAAERELDAAEKRDDDNALGRFGE